MSLTSLTRPTPVGVNLKPIDLDDPKKFWSRPGVPILDEHVFTPPARGDRLPQPPEPFDAARLRLIVDNCNLRAGHGEYAVLRFGHIDYRANVPESAQPEPIGYAKNFRLAPWVDTDTGRVVKPGLFVISDFFFLVRITKEQVESFPHRSIEMDRYENIIDGVSLLRRPPERPLGLLTYARSAASPVARPRVQRALTQAELREASRLLDQERLSPAEAVRRVMRGA